MSADNIIYIIPFKREDGVVVHRVCEVRVSGEEFELLDAMKNGKYTEHEGPKSHRSARAGALWLSRELDVCEYGVSEYSTEPVDITHFENKVVERKSWSY